MELINSIEDASSSYSSQTHPLIDKWVLWAHLPHNTDWSLKSYIKLQNLETVEDVVSITNAIPEKMVKNCMLFLMRKNINPVWEDPLNCNGGCFSFKVLNKDLIETRDDFGILTIELCGDKIVTDAGLSAYEKAGFKGVSKIEDNKIRVLTMEMIVAIPTRKAFE